MSPPPAWPSSVPKKAPFSLRFPSASGWSVQLPVPRRMLPQRPLLSRLTWSTEGLSTSLVGSGWQRLGAGRREKAPQSLGHLDLSEGRWSLQIKPEIPPGAWPMSCFWSLHWWFQQATDPPGARTGLRASSLPTSWLALRAQARALRVPRVCVRACVSRGQASREQVSTSRWQANFTTRGRF